MCPCGRRYQYLGIKKFKFRNRAPEVLESMDFSLYSDIWAFGLLMWQAMTRGSEPFHFTSIEGNFSCFHKFQ
jgi:serine/threonine protein kinase